MLGAIVSVTTASLLVRAAGGGELLARTAAPKATTTPVAIALAERLDGIAPLAAVLAILAGILGAVVGPMVLDLLRIRDPRARGIALGSVSHGIGTGRLLHDDETQGAFSGLAMGLTALATSALLPVLTPLLSCPASRRPIVCDAMSPGQRLHRRRPRRPRRRRAGRGDPGR